MRKSGFMMLAMLATVAGCAASSQTPDQVFSHEVPSAFWQETYAAIAGDTWEQKSSHARTTLDAKALAEMELHEKKKKLERVGMKLWESLLPELAGMEDRPRERFLKTHRAWLDYIEQQAAFIANTSGGGSMYSLIARSVMIDEIEWRTRLYQDLLDGKNAVKDELYFYR